MSKTKRFSSKGVDIKCPEPLIELIKETIRFLDDNPGYVKILQAFLIEIKRK